MSLVVTTPVLTTLNTVAIKDGLNRAFDATWLDTNADPDGLHIIEVVMLHNDVEWRTRVFVKVKGSMEPTIGWLDMSFKSLAAAEKVDRMVREHIAKQDAEDEALAKVQ